MKSRIASVFLLFALSIFSCKEREVRTITAGVEKNISQIINPEAKTIATRFDPPKKYNRDKNSRDSYEAYLRFLPLKESNATVNYYNGSSKLNHNTYLAVIDLPIGNKDLHQCADAIMRLRAEYLWNKKAFDKIHFNFTNGFRVDYSQWLDGKRMVVQGNKTFWKAGAKRSNSYEDFWAYMELIFTFAGTLSLSKELVSVPLPNMQIGDILIQGGSPGHAVVVVDMAINKQTKEKVYMLAQSYMPAQELQILCNPQEPSSPWFHLNNKSTIQTPEWTFTSNDLKSFAD